MSEKKQPGPGAIVWTDLSVANATEIKSFYESVVGWQASEHEMNGYADYNMKIPGGKTAAGICHARGENADMPPQWLVYLTVDDLDASLEKTTQQGGKVVAGPKSYGSGRFAVIQDPAGAVCALYQG